MENQKNGINQFSTSSQTNLKAGKAPNYLERIPEKNSRFSWSANSDGMVTVSIENTGVFNRIAQRLFHRPRITYVHLDRLGSFIWPLIDGEKDILLLGEEVRARFGKKAEPLYERLAKYFQILESYHFIRWKEKSTSSPGIDCRP